jgi:hypothetical protein
MNNMIGGNTAQVRVLQGARDPGGFDVLVDGKLTFTPANSIAMASQNYLPIAAGTHKMTLTLHGTANSALDFQSVFAANSRQTIVLAGQTSDNSLTAITLVEDPTPPAAGTFRIRFANASTAAPLDLYVASAGTTPPMTPTFPQVAFKDVTAFLSLPTGQDVDVCSNTSNPGLPSLPGLCTGISGRYTWSTRYQPEITIVFVDPPIVPNAPPGTIGFAPPVVLTY